MIGYNFEKGSQNSVTLGVSSLLPGVVHNDHQSRIVLIRDESPVVITLYQMYGRNVLGGGFYLIALHSA